MASSSIGKREREQAKKAKADAKRQRRERNTDPQADADESQSAQAAGGAPMSTDDLLEMIAALHSDYDDGRLSFDDFEAKKAELMARLVVD